MAEPYKVTYATLTADNEDLHTAYEQGIEKARGWLGEEIAAPGDPNPSEPIEVHSPADPSVVVATVRPASTEAIDTAIAEAKQAGKAWAATPWQERVRILRDLADTISEQANELAALMTIEVGKNRLEALGDVEESAVFFRYYADQVENNGGFDAPMDSLSDKEKTRSVLKPFGVWGVIGPFNFPMALVAGPAAAALVAGNAVVVKPSVQGTHVAWRLHQLYLESELPTGLVQFLPGGDEVGKAIVAHDGIDGLTFTGSYAGGMAVAQAFRGAYPKPVVTEMGGKNPTIVTANADLDLAASGIARSIAGASGQKCSACSRIYVDPAVHDELVEKLSAALDNFQVADPLERTAFLGPVIDQAAVDRYRAAVEHAEQAGGTIAAGGEVLQGQDGYPGYFVRPTLVSGLPSDDKLFTDELFVPFAVVAPVDSLDEALDLANDTVFGLTAGFFGAEDEIDTFLDRIEAGVVYVNRAAGATTGAWPGVQPFGGWKGSGSSGKAGGGLHYVQLFMREQSQTVVSG
ncbi:aldehyde dehydrogenase family protein [Ornithinimicrobium sp. Y1847]|uniref:aldehyde dehydrogenase family protein n=1 Tax=Ornithinimicrobium sp. Y1847 TaxID=3405419 RepID=UPI003B66DE13